MITKREELNSIERCTRILEFWHKVEFFIPYDLESRILDHADKDWAVRRISAKYLASLAPLDVGNLWSVKRIPQGKRLYGFELFFGIFDKGLLSREVQKALDRPTSDLEEIEDLERGDYEGLTCFAKISLNHVGEPKWDSVSVSTVPWALGRLHSSGLQALDFNEFQVGLCGLQHELADFQTQRVKRRSERETANESNSNDGDQLAPLPIVRADIERLIDIFCSWAGFTPDPSEFPVLVIRAQAIPNSQSTAKSEGARSESPDSGRKESEPKTGDDAEDDENDVEHIDILNSFYVRDIQQVLKAAPIHGIPATLLAYLTPVPSDRRVSVYSSQGHKLLRTALHPSRLPRGRWLGEADHYMSLMQQFAINKAFEATQSEGVFAVNGPPGTGKTTLLRDMFAEIVTRRARVLANMSCAREAFLPGPSVQIEFEGVKKPYYISILKKELTGFEMVVVSTNNSAVENISRDLPKASALGNQRPDRRDALDWRDEKGFPKCTYLQQVAEQYAARNSKGSFDPLAVDDKPWALVSCVLGNKTNRNRFIHGVFGKAKSNGQGAPEGYDPQRHQSLWEWRTNFSGPSFSEAADAFRRAESQLAERQEQLVKYIDALEELDGMTLEEYTAVDRQRLESADAVLRSAHAELDLIVAELAAVASQISSIDRLRLRNQEPKISILKWLLSPEARRTYKAAVATFEEEKRHLDVIEREALRKKIALGPREIPARSAATAAASVYAEAKKCLNTRESRWNHLKQMQTHLESRFPEAEEQWRRLDGLEQVEVQRTGLWPDPELNLRRSTLFATALALHEAWLAEVLMNNGGFGGNLAAIYPLLEGTRLRDSQQSLPIWQSLFMMVPVVSSTFASFANQFRNLGPSSIGWLFIDEAGQAVPQAAVGALWRCSRAMVVGDPLQIEPVFTVPARLIEALARSGGVVEAHVSPAKRSVQNLADETNAIGVEVTDPANPNGKTWIGSPLRVHRRCSDPMFIVANAIAYEGKMIFGATSKSPPPDALDIGSTAWVHISGTVEDKQVVHEQIELAAAGILMLARAIGKFPPLYVISPFRRIAEVLRAKLADVGDWTGVLGKDGKTLTKSAVRNWCKSNIGTVHTFQGKQASIVWMILGCDKTTEGAVGWAAGRPNMLNVALTRAEHRFFMIGDIDVWGGRKYFRELKAANVQQITPSEFLARIELVGTTYKTKMAPHLEV